MTRLTAAAAALLCLVVLSTEAEARRARHRNPAPAPSHVRIEIGAEGTTVFRSVPEFGTRSTRAVRHWHQTSTSKVTGGISLVGVAEALASKVRQIVSTCGSHVTSALRNTKIAGTRRTSLHASGRAVDVQGNPDCIYAQLQGTSFSYTTDYARVRHVHISDGCDIGRECKITFVHGGHRRHAKRHKHHRYARV